MMDLFLKALIGAVVLEIVIKRFVELYLYVRKKVNEKDEH